MVGDGENRICGPNALLNFDYVLYQNGVMQKATGYDRCEPLGSLYRARFQPVSVRT